MEGNFQDTIDDLSLDEILRENAINHADPNHEKFFSPGLVADILTRERIINEIQRFNPVDPETLADTIRSRYCNVFAILTLIEKGGDIEAFIQEGVADEDLPLVNCSTIKKSRSMLARNRTPHIPLNCLSMWRTHSRDSFARWQHRLDVAYLDLEPDRRTIKHENYNKSRIFPWTEYKEREIGGYGTVAQVKVHPKCHGFHDLLQSIITHDDFALKQLLTKPNDELSKSEKAFWKEVDMLKRFSGFVHDHLVTLLMTWTIEDQFYLLFPLAGCDLDRYWEKDENRPISDSGTNMMDIATIRWISKQILGMTGALDSLHNPKTQHLRKEHKFGRHGDLKPENVLFYESPMDAKGILVIADFGLSAFNSDQSRSNIPNKEIPFTPGYRPPECDLEGGTISRSYDIWTFGCLLLELVCWALDGSQSRGRFADARMSPYITGSQSDIFFDVQVKQGGYAIMVKREVTEWIAWLHGLPACTEYFHDLLDLVEDEMVVTLSADEGGIRSPKLLKKIRVMHERVMDETDPECQLRCPQKRAPKYCVPVDAQLKQNCFRLGYEEQSWAS